MLSGAGRSDDWESPVVLTEAVNDKGTAEVAAAISKHRDYLIATRNLETRRRRRAELELVEDIEGLVKDSVNAVQESAEFKRVVDDLLEGRAVPRHAAAEIAARLAENLKKS